MSKTVSARRNVRNRIRNLYDDAVATKQYSRAIGKEVVVLTNKQAPSGSDQWGGNELATIVKQHVWRIAMAEAARRVANEVAGARSQTAAADQIAAAMFARALENDSERELDWLLMYCRAGNASRRRYCLERALAINPHSEVALAALHRMPLAD